jgi:hypothetical protein
MEWFAIVLIEAAAIFVIMSNMVDEEIDQVDLPVSLCTDQELSRNNGAGEFADLFVTGLEQK